MKPTFLKLNDGWNAEPNAPTPEILLDGRDVLLSFQLNHIQFPEFKEGDLGVLRFENCQRYRVGTMNDEGWYEGQCRYSKLAPAWGEFYLITGASKFLEIPRDWLAVGAVNGPMRHFLFYFRDNDFECIAERCTIESSDKNSLVRTGKKLPAMPASKS